MSRRTDKKRAKKGVCVQTKESGYEMYIQYRGEEYDVEVIAESIRKNCEKEGKDCSELKIYVKPEDGKAYYTCAGGNGALEL